jgi:nucleoside-diphosphate-sugar epimerase
MKNMRIFVTGATGFVGSAVVRELLDAGYQVVGLARSDAAASSLAALGAQPHRGDLEDLESLRSGVAASDAVIHTAFNHDWANYEANCEMERRAVEALGSAIEGSDRLLIITSGTALVSPGRLASEEDTPVLTAKDFPRMATFDAARALAERGVRIIEVRLSPSVHGDGDHGFVPTLINIAREKGVSAYVGDGTNRWTAVHRLDAATLYRLALERGSAGFAYHAVDEEAIAFRDIAEVIGKRLNVPVVSKSPEEAADHFGWLARFAQLDCPASSKLTRERLGWQPVQPRLLLDLEHSTRYFEALTLR